MIFVDVNNGMSIVCEEIFGLVGIIISFDMEEEVIVLVNDLCYGLVVMVWIGNLVCVYWVVVGVKVGVIGVNCWSLLDVNLFWGGIKDSGMGCEGGLVGVLVYIEEKIIMVLLVF